MTSVTATVSAPTSAATELRESMMAVTRQMRRHRPDHG
ncbi:MAG TPA: MarR family transcriptional regulator, partial [Mycobacterium sp.]|nr:MarR family transcriptional regulator [Mycobacterium sp.]